MRHRDGRPDESIQFSVTADKKLIKKFKGYCFDNDLTIHKEFEDAIRLYFQYSVKSKMAPSKRLVTTPKTDTDTMFEGAKDLIDGR